MRIYEPCGHGTLGGGGRFLQLRSMEKKFYWFGEEVLILQASLDECCHGNLVSGSGVNGFRASSHPSTD